MDTFKLRILAADHPFYEGECESLSIPIFDGSYGIQARHSNMTAAVVPGLLHFRRPGAPEQAVAVTGGIAKVEDNEVVVLVDAAERPEDIDELRAQRAAAAAREALLQKKTLQEYRMAEAKLARALNRIRIKRSNMH